jgi:transglutaminase-like putative cysteine protease
MRTSPAPGLLRLALVAALTAVAGLSFAPVFGGFGVAFVLAVLVPAAVAGGWALWARTRDSVSPGMAGLGVLAVCGAVGATTLPGGEALSGPHRLWTSALPVDPAGPELAVPSMMAGFAALVGCYLATRRRGSLLPVLPALACLLSGLGLGAATGGLPAWYPSLLIALLGLFLVAGRTVTSGAVPPAGAALRRWAAVAGLLLAGTAGPILLVPLAPGSDAREPADVRVVIPAPVRPKAQTNPLAQYLALRDGPLLVKITGTASEQVDRLRMVTLTEFDGHNWSTSADYRRADHRLPPPRDLGATRQITMDVTVDNAETLGWLPTPGRAEDISVTGMGVDGETGDVVVPAATMTPTAYRVTGVEPVVAGEDLLADEPVRLADPPEVQLPPDVLGFLTKATGTEVTASGRLLALYRALSSAPFGYDGSSTEAAGGHGLFQISALLRDKRGTSEQYASALAVMYRQLGWDARVVLGFRPRWNGTALTVTGADVHAWVEVRYARSGWVPVDPTPRQASPGREPEQEPALRHVDPLNSLPDPGQSAPVSRSDLGPGAAPAPGTPVWVTALITAILLVTVPLAATPVAKGLRRARRRRTGSHRTRAAAAWHEIIDALTVAGHRPPRGATTGEIVRSSGDRCPPELRDLALRIDNIAFAPEEPSDEAVTGAWSYSDQIRKAVTRQLRPIARFRAAIDPRPLLMGNR